MAKAKGKGKAKATEPTRVQLEELAEEMNDVMDLDPKIKVNKRVTDAKLTEAIMSEAGAIYTSDFKEDPDDDDFEPFTDEAAETMELLGIEPKDSSEEDDEEEEVEEKPAKKGKGKGKGKAKPEPEEEDEEDEDEDDDDEPPVKKGKGKDKPAKPAKKGKGKKAVEEDDDDEDEDEKPVKKGKAKAKSKNASKPMYKRAQAFCDALEKGGTKQELIKIADDLYVENNEGALSNYTTTEVTFRYTMPALLILGFVEKDDDGAYSLS